MSARPDSMIQNKNKFDILRVLKSVPLLSGLTSSERSELCAGLTTIGYNLNDYIMHEGDEGSTFYIIVSGQVSVIVSGTEDQVIGTLTSGDYCGEQALLQNTTRNASLKCITNHVECLMCEQNIFGNIFENNNSIQFVERNPQRNAFVSNDTMDEINSNNEMDDSTIGWLLGCINSNVLFKQLTIEQKKEIFKFMKVKNVKFNDIIIKQSEIGINAQTFYIVVDGEYDTFIDDVRRPSSHYSRGGWFGELALLHNSPRAATIKCVSINGGLLYEITRKQFRFALQNLQNKKMNENILFLKSISLFEPLLASELLHLNDALEEQVFIGSNNLIIYKQNDNANHFYLIKKGKIKWHKNETNENGILEKGQFFGEMALRMNTKRAATISIASDEEIILLSMSKNDFEELLGPVIQIIDNKINQYKRTDDMNIEQKEEIIIEQKEENENENICKLTEFETIGILGKGGFGLVTLVCDPKTNKTYALKAIKKYQIIESNLVQHIISEKNVMFELSQSQNKNKNHANFLVNLHKTYKNKLRIYFLLDVCLGGELFTILRMRKFFNEKTAKFYAGSVIIGFQYMHSKNIIYRDMKPENLVLNEKGYLKITDFGFAKKIIHKTYTFCGTPDYLCPEIITGQGHGKGVDWWTLGILIYEMLSSFAPFVAEQSIQTYKKILKGKIKFPKFFTKESRDIIYKLLQHKSYKRLGVIKGGANKIKKHIWFKGFEWNKLNNQTMKPPIINKVKSKKDLTNFKLQQHHKIHDFAKEIHPKDEFDHLF